MLSWFVLDEEDESAAAYADTLMVSRGLLDSGYLQAVLAHELGHLNTSDGRLTAALHRITTPPRGEVRLGLRTICFFASGAAGMWPLRAAWGAYLRSREHHADHYAANLGQANNLGDFLDERRALTDLPVPFIWLTEHSHPPTEHRVERLTRAAHAQVSPTPRATDRTSQQQTRSPLDEQARKAPGARPGGDLLGVPYTWLLAQARAGQIPHHRLGHYVRFDPDDLQTWLSDTKVEAASGRTFPTHRTARSTR